MINSVPATSGDARTVRAAPHYSEVRKFVKFERLEELDQGTVFQKIFRNLSEFFQKSTGKSTTP